MVFIPKMFDSSPRETSPLRWIFLVLVCLSKVHFFIYNKYRDELHFLTERERRDINIKQQAARNEVICFLLFEFFA